MRNSKEPLAEQHPQPDWIGEALAIELATPAVGTLQRRLYAALRRWVQQGRLPGGSRLPSSRWLARQLGLGRNTVLGAIDRLVAEGFLETRHGAGTFVAELAHFASLSEPSPTQPAALSSRGERTLASCRLPDSASGAFAPGVPALELFPRAAWRRLIQRHLREAPMEWLDYQAQGGVGELREAICHYVRLSRSVDCSPRQVLVVNGAQQAFESIARLLADSGDRAWMEEPGYVGAQAALAAAELDVAPVPVDAQGLDPERAPRDRAPRLIYVTPSHQYPCGVTLSLERRLELLALAERHAAWIIEDDYDSEFRYRAQPIASLQGLADSQRVLYVGTFSKSLYPGLRLGYLILPNSLVEPFRRLQARLYREGHYPIQAALAEFIATGHFARHVKRMREVYRHRQALLRETLAPAVARGLALSPGESGMHLLARLPPGSDEQALMSKGARHGITLRPLSRHYLGDPDTTGLVLGYAGATDAEIRRAGALLCEWLLPLFDA